MHPAEENEGGNRRNHQTDDPCGDAGSVGKRFPDGIGLHHAADEAQRDDNRYRKEPGQELAEAALEGTLDVIDRTALYAAVLIDLAGFLRQHGFGVDGGHAEKGDDPHPENSAGAADEDSAAGTDDITGTDLGGDGGGQRLEGAEPSLLLAAVHAEVAEHPAHPFAEAAYLHKAGADGKVQSGAYQQDNENIIRKIAVDGLNDFEQCCFHLFHS